SLARDRAGQMRSIAHQETTRISKPRRAAVMHGELRGPTHVVHMRVHPDTAVEQGAYLRELGRVGDVDLRGLLEVDEDRLPLLRTRSQRPSGSRATNQRDELAAGDHSITSSASNCNELGTSMPSALAVCRLMTNSNLVDCKTGRSAGFAPLRIWPV